MSEYPNQQYPEGYYSQPPPYPGQPVPPNYFVQPRTTNGLAIASLVVGILWIYWIGSILALIFGYVARNQIRQRNQGGEGMAIAGIVLGWIGVGVFCLVIFFVILAASSDPGTTY